MLSESQRTYGAFDLGNQFKVGKNVVRCTWDFAVNAGAVGSSNLLDQTGNIVTLPDKAIITQAYIDVVTAMTSAGGAGTIAITANAAGDIKAAVDADTLSGVVAGIPVGTAATMIKLTAARTILATIAVEALTAGKINVFIEYVLSS